MAMRKALSLLALALLLAAPLTGCLSAGDAGEDMNAGEQDEGGNSSEAWEQMPDNRSGDYAAFRETNATEDGAGGHAHTHDYWEGRTRVSLFETTAEMPPQPDSSGASVVFRPPPPALVYEGTARVEMTVTNPQRHVCNPDGATLDGEYICTSNLDYHSRGAAPGDTYAPNPSSPPALEVEFLHGASDPDGWISAGTIEWDTPFTIEVGDPMWTDMPHATASLWAFRFTSSEPIANTFVFDVSMDVLRDENREIPLWPGHPDFYADRNSRLVHEGGGATSDAGQTGETETIQPERLISYGTTTLHVWANVTRVEGLEPTHWYLRFHNASFTNWNITDPFDDAYSADNKENYWILRVDPEGMDSPYQSLSRWEIQFRGAHTTPAISCYAGCFPYRVEYDMVVIATNEELPDDAYAVTERAS